MQNLTRGQKLKLSDLTPSTFFGVGLQTNAPGLVFDISCFGVDENNKLSDDRYFVFYNQKASPEGALRQMGPQGGDTETFAVNLAELPAHIRRLVFTITIDGNGTMSQLQTGHVRIVVAGQEIARFAFTGRDFSTEKAIIAAEIYFKDTWRVAAVGQGFAGGLSALLKHYGGEEVAPSAVAPIPPASNTSPAPIPPAPRPSFSPPAPVNAPPPAAAPPASPYPPAPPRPNTPNNSAYPPPAAPPAAAPPAYAPPIPAPRVSPVASPAYPPAASPSVSTPTMAPPVSPAPTNGMQGAGAPNASRPLNLSKITLDKQGEKSAVNLKKGGGTQPIHINLNWDNPNVGLYGGTNSMAPDLDLGCMFRLKNGVGSVIQPLGGNFGARDKEPFIFLDKDDRSGAAQDGENLYIYRPDLIESVMVFALIYQGAPNFMAVNARLTLRDQDGNEIFIRLNNPDHEHAFCCICTIRNHGDHIEIIKEERYVPGHREADQNFGFNFRWAAGSK